MVTVFYKNILQNIVVYLLKARTVEAEKQPLLGNGPYTRSRGTRHVCCEARNNRRNVISMAWALLIATQRYGKHISSAVNQHATIEESVFSVGAAPRLYNEDLTQIELELRESAVEGDWKEILRKELRVYKKDFMCAAVTVRLL
jgi:hypothetical protein